MYSPYFLCVDKVKTHRFQDLIKMQHVVLFISIDNLGDMLWRAEGFVCMLVVLESGFVNYLCFVFSL